MIKLKLAVRIRKMRRENLWLQPDEGFWAQARMKFNDRRVDLSCSLV